MNHPLSAGTGDLRSLARDRVVPEQSDVVPDVLRSFLDGAVSFPHDWWPAIQWSLGLKGVYGDRMQRNCETIAKRLNIVCCG